MDIFNIVILIITIIFLGCLTFSMYKKNVKIENFKDLYNIEYDPYDEQYASLSNIIYNDQKVIKNDVKQIINNIPNYIEKRILDIGCGCGNYTKEFKNNNYKIIGVDRSKNMLKKATIEHSDCDFIRGDAINSDTFEKNSFPIIYIGHNVLNLNTHHEISQIIKNCKKWLTDNGVIILHISDNKNPDIFPREYSQFYKDNSKNEDIKKVSFTHFKTFRYDRWFTTKNNMKNKFHMYEKILLPNTKERIKRTNLTILSYEDIINILINNKLKLFKKVKNRFNHQYDDIFIFNNV